MSKSINLAVIAGDGIGPEVVAEGLRVLDVVGAKHGVTFNKTSYDLGAGYWHRTGEVLPDSVMGDRKSTRLNSSHVSESRMPSSA